jgi:hypothetical protein
MGFFNLFKNDKNVNSDFSKAAQDDAVNKAKDIAVRNAVIVPAIPKPTSQLSETLYLLLESPKRGVTRKEFMDRGWIMNSPHQIMVLRRKGVGIETIEIQRTNKFGRNVTFSIYKLKDVVLSTQQYNAMNTKSKK